MIRKENFVPENHANIACRAYAGQGYEVTRFARKHGITRQQAREIIKKIGNDREKLNEAALALKGSAGQNGQQGS
jgi:hypothetical protein